MRVMSENEEHMKRTVQVLIQEGGEGVILQLSGSLYVPGRTSTLVKIKVKLHPKFNTF